MRHLSKEKIKQAGFASLGTALLLSPFYALILFLGNSAPAIETSIKFFVGQ